MKRVIQSVGALVAVAVAVHLFYEQVIRPQAEKVLDAARLAGQHAPRDWVVVMKDWEQEACMILAIYCVIQIVLRMAELAKEQYLYDVDLLEDAQDTLQNETLEKLEALPDKIGRTHLLETLKASLRRYRITNDVQNTSDAIETSVEALAMRLEADNTMIRYIIWAIPSIGFIGTVRGIGQALSQADQALAGDIAGMAASLGVAFNSTFVALLVSVFLMLLLHALQKIQDRRLVDIQSYCEKFLMERISR